MITKATNEGETMDAISFGVWITFAMVIGAGIGYFAAIDSAKKGLLIDEGITYSYFNTKKSRMRRACRAAMRETK